MTSTPATTIAPQLSETEARLAEDLLIDLIDHDSRCGEVDDALRMAMGLLDAEPDPLRAEELLFDRDEAIADLFARIVPAVLSRARAISSYLTDPDEVQALIDAQNGGERRDALLRAIFEEAGIAERFVFYTRRRSQR